MQPPHWSLALTEAPRALIELSGLQFSKCLLRKAPRGDGHGVMVIPGFMGDDSFNRPLVNFLNGLGYRATGWQMGRNLGPRSFSTDDLRIKLEDLARAGDGTVSLIGHSLGGIYAREMARMAPDAIRQVISLGTPFGDGNDSGSHASSLYKRLNPDHEADPETLERREQLAEAPPVPTTSIYTKGDGVVNWRTTVQSKDHDQTQNIQVIGSHTGLTLNPAVWYLLADRLHTANTWQHFESALFNHH